MFLDETEWAVFICLRGGCSIASIHCHVAVAVRGFLVVLSRVQPCGFMAVRCYNGNFVRIVASQVSIDEYEDARDGFGEREGIFERCPCVRVGIDDDGQKGRGKICK